MLTDPMTSINFEHNARKLRSSIPARPLDHHRQWASMMTPVHGTTLEGAEAILESGEILPYSELEPTIDPDTPSPYLTDQLDIDIGQHRYVFWNIGKTNPLEVAPVYFCADPSLTTQPYSFVAMKDITAYGAMVSQEAQIIRKLGDPTIDVDKINLKAVKKFFESIVRGGDFGRILAKFFAQHYPNIGDDLGYWRDVTYPTEELTIDTRGLEARSNIWAGPQLQTKGRIALESVKAVIITDPEIETPRTVGNFPWITVGKAKDFADYYAERMGKYTLEDPLEQNFNRSFYANLAIRQLVLGLINSKV